MQFIGLNRIENVLDSWLADSWMNIERLFIDNTTAKSILTEISIIDEY